MQMLQKSCIFKINKTKIFLKSALLLLNYILTVPAKRGIVILPEEAETSKTAVSKQLYRGFWRGVKKQ